MHSTQTTFHTLDVFIYIWWALDRAIIFFVAQTAPASIARLKSSHPC